MAVNLLIGYKNADGTIESICPRMDGWADEEKLLYKYYRTPQRVKALVNNGYAISSLGISISKDEVNPNSHLYNEEVANLPINIGFPEDDFYPSCNYYSDHGEKIEEKPLKYADEEAFFDKADSIWFSSQCIFLYDSVTQTWTEGYDKIDLRTAILNTFDDECQYEYDSEEEIKKAKQELLNSLNEIDSFIEKRKNGSKKILVDINQNLFLDYPEIYEKYAELVKLAISKGVIVNVNFYKPVEAQEQKIARRVLKPNNK